MAGLESADNQVKADDYHVADDGGGYGAHHHPSPWIFCFGYKLISTAKMSSYLNT
jgi:hypothetical protein